MKTAHRAGERDGGRERWRGRERGGGEHVEWARSGAMGHRIGARDIDHRMGQLIKNRATNHRIRYGNLENDVIV